MKSTFGSKNVIIEQISEADLKTYLVGFDINDDGERKYRWKNLINLLQDALTEFAFGYHEGEAVHISKSTKLLVEAAKAVYKIDEFTRTKKIYVDDESYIDDDAIDKKYLKRGEFGELILHLLLRDYHNTIPLLSKIYFKDSYGVPVHGFDAVHIQPDTKTLWLGESKLYTDGKKGIEALIEDIKEHFKMDYLNQEFTLISKKLKHMPEETVPQKQHWLELMDSNKALREVFTSINIPLICTYSSNLFNEFDDEIDPQFLSFYEEEVRDLEEHFNLKNDHPLKEQLNIILLLFPVQCKNTLIKRMHKKLFTLQGIYDDE
ncbi:HamA C-terminal domain-containing protein [Paenibacillus humicus]|uniref:HamA C-terminal domain-containing protein n=1 Tax=Paenibacillus humicus TaxID=412861 RepID=UPI003D2BB5A3